MQVAYDDRKFTCPEKWGYNIPQSKSGVLVPLVTPVT